MQICMHFYTLFVVNFRQLLLMQKSLFLFLGLAFTLTSAIAQDSAYYHTAFNSQDDTLKARLHNIISNHIEFPYSSSSTDVWDILKDTDKDTLNTNNVILIYSNRSVNAAQEYNNGSGWNREHVWAKSRGNFGNSKGAGTDVHHLRPCDISVNSTRNNRNFDDCVTCVDVIDNGFNTGSKRDASQWTFQPPSNVKGDVARMIFYMVVRYEGDPGEPDLELTNTLLNNTSQQPLHARWSTLLDWHRQDPVSNWERTRNLVIYNDYQQNRNPFIDYPELAEYLFGDSIGMVWKPQTFVSIEEEQLTRFELYPNPTNDAVTLRFLQVPTEVIVRNSKGQEVKKYQPTALKSQVNTQDLANGIYIVEVVHSSAVSRKRLVVSH